MAKYYTQNAEAEKDGKSAKYVVFGETPAHDHGNSNDFSKAVTAALKKQYPGAEVRLSAYKSNQNKPTSGNLLEFKHNGKVWLLK